MEYDRERDVSSVSDAGLDRSGGDPRVAGGCFWILLLDFKVCFVPDFSFFGFKLMQMNEER